MKPLDIFSLSYRTIRSNKLRTGLTVAIIAFGIMALIGIITAIKAMNQKLTESFSTMGANGFIIRFKEPNVRFGHNNNSGLTLSKKGARTEKKSNLGKPITIDQAEAFLQHFHFPATAGISTIASRNAIASYGTHKTSPNLFLFGGDEAYIPLNGFQIDAGRNFTHQEIQSGANVCLLGHDVADRLFKNDPAKAVNQIIRLNDIPFRVLAVLGSRGSSFGFSRDNIVITGYRNIRRNFDPNGTYSIGVMTDDIKLVPDAMGETEGIFRPIRQLNVTEESNFVIDRSDSIAEKAMNSLGFLTTAVAIIGIITLIGSAIGLMNTMLVAVNERTKEVGLIKAIGGKKKAIRQQFIIEAVLISVFGALFGILFGILVGNGFSLLLKTGFVIPWAWVAYGIIICSTVGLLAGLYPALKAGKLNPIDALRYE
jgi:putative ABC transport system permease protein